MVLLSEQIHFQYFEEIDFHQFSMVPRRMVFSEIKLAARYQIFPELRPLLLYLFLGIEHH